MPQPKPTNPLGAGLRKFSIEQARDWMQYSGVSLADVLNEDEQPGVKLGAVGFMRAPAGQTTSFSFDYDEALIVTKGQCTVTSAGQHFTAKAGEVLYLHAGTPGTFHTDADTELVYVASSPYGALNREAKRALLGRG